MSPNPDHNVVSDDYFNNGDASGPSRNSESGGSPGNRSNGERQPPNNDSLPKLKRTACVLCRKRKLKCDGAKPKCGTCDRLGHDCHYDHIRKKSGPKRGYVRDLERRLQQLEGRLNTNDAVPATSQPAAQADMSAFHDPMSMGSVPLYSTSGNGVGANAPTTGIPDLTQDAAIPLGDEDYSWEMISLGLTEPLPDAGAIRELEEIYFEKVHPSAPIIHRARYRAAMDLAPGMRPPICLRYAMWTLAAGLTDKYAELTDHFYHRSRKYLELDEMRGHGENLITLSHCQTWVLLVVHEFKCMYFPRAWMSTGRAVRLSQMLGLHRLDGVGLDVKQCLPVPRDWTEREERRRTYWMAFWEDRCASIGTGWPMSFDESDILTNLPASEDAYQNSRSERSISLQEALETGSQDISSFAGTVVMSALFGRNLLHLHRPEQDDRDHDLNGKFWQRHRAIDETLSRISLGLPDRLKIPMGLPDPNVIFLNMCIHTSIICLHQAAIFKADKNGMDANISGTSKMFCISAAEQIASIMRCVATYDLSAMNPFTAFCLYVAARVFVQYLKARRDEQRITSLLTFIFSAMHRIKQKNPLTESFLAQLEVDMESANLPIPKVSLGDRAYTMPEEWRKNPGCSLSYSDGIEYQPVPMTGYRETDAFQDTLADRSRKSSTPSIPGTYQRMQQPQQQTASGFEATPTDEMDCSPNSGGEYIGTGVSSNPSQHGNPFTPPESENNDVPRKGSIHANGNWHNSNGNNDSAGVGNMYISNMNNANMATGFMPTQGLDMFDQMDPSAWSIGDSGLTPIDDGLMEIMAGGLSGNWNAHDSRTQAQWASVNRQS